MPRSLVRTSVAAAAFGVLVCGIGFDPAVAGAAADRNAPVTLPPPYSSVADLVSGQDDSVWFVDPTVEAVGAVSADGATSTVVLPAGSSPVDLTRGRDGAVWYADADRAIVGTVSSTGTISEIPLPQPADRATALTSAGDGALWLAFTNRAVVARLTSAGLQEFPLPESFGSVTDLVLGPDARVWFADARGPRLGALAVDGEIAVLGLVSDRATAPRELATGADGRIWFTDTDGRLASSDMHGSVRWTDAGGSGARAASPLLGPDARVWFTDSANGRIGWVDPGDALSFALPAGLPHPSSLAVGSGPVIWAADGESGTLARLDLPLTAVPLPDSGRDTLLLVGAGLILFAVLSAVIVLVVALVRRGIRRRPRTDDFRELLITTPPSKIDPKPVSSDLRRRWSRAAAARLFSDEGRDGAVDIARWIAVLGLAALVVVPPDLLGLPASVQPYAAPALLAVIALGVGMSIERRCHRVAGLEGIVALQVRARLLTEGVALLTIGAVVSVTGSAHSDVVVVLAALVLVSVFLLQWRTGSLVLLAVCVGIVAPLAILAAGSITPTQPVLTTALTLVAPGTPVALGGVLAPAVLTGVIVQRGTRSRVRSGVCMLVIGLVLGLTGYGVAVGAPLAADAVTLDLSSAVRPPGYSGPWIAEALGVDGALLSPFVVAGSVGAALILTGLLRVIWWPLKWVLFPLTSAGSIALSLWAGGAIAISLVPSDAMRFSWTTAFVVPAAAMLGATVWKLFLPRGPLESIIEACARRSAALGRIPAGASRRTAARESAVRRRVRSNWTNEGRRPVHLDGSAAPKRV